MEPQKLVEIVQRSLSQLLERAGIPRKRMLGIGLAISGFVDREHGICLHSANLGWHDVPIASLITRATGLPTVLENDANAAATSEKLFGLARETTELHADHAGGQHRLRPLHRRSALPGQPRRGRRNRP